jgi:hypothetical protein
LRDEATEEPGDRDRGTRRQQGQRPQAVGATEVGEADDQGARRGDDPLADLARCQTDHQRQGEADRPGDRQGDGQARAVQP